MARWIWPALLAICHAKLLRNRKLSGNSPNPISFETESTQDRRASAQELIDFFASRALQSLDTRACSLRAEVQCEPVLPSTPGDCNSLAAPSVMTCTSRPTQLMWIYTGGTCADSTTTDFSCEGDIEKPKAPLSVFVTAQDENENILWSDKVGLGSLFPITSLMTNTLRLNIYEFDQDLGGRAGDLLQCVELQIGGENCVEMLSQYGGLQLTGFETDTDGYQSVFESVRMTFSVHNEGDSPAVVEDMEIDSELFGESALISSPGREVAPGETLSYPFETFLINMFELGANMLDSSMTASGSSNAGSSCTTEHSLDIGMDTRTFYFETTGTDMYSNDGLE